MTRSLSARQAVVRATGRLLHLVSEQALVSGWRRGRSLPLRNRGAVAPPPLELAIARDEQRQLAARVGAPSMCGTGPRQSTTRRDRICLRGEVGGRAPGDALGPTWEHRAPTAGTIAFVFLAGTERTSAMATKQSCRSAVSGAVACDRFRPRGIVTSAATGRALCHASERPRR